MPVIFCSRQDAASARMLRCLIERHGFSKREQMHGQSAWEKNGVFLVELEERGVYFESMPFSSDYFIFASRHSGEGGPCLTLHCPGNWTSKAELGGKPETVSLAPARRMKQAFLALSKSSQKLGWPVFMEATHHGPSLSTPCFFMEVGSSEKEWASQPAADAVAGAIAEAVFSPEPKSAPVFGVGGGHYCPKFTSIQQEAGYAIGHVLPKYCAEEITFSSFLQGIEKTVPRAEKVLIDWKGLNSVQRSKMISFCEKAGIGFERV